MTPAGTSNELDVQNGWEENTHKTNRHLIFSFVYWYNRQVLILLMIGIDVDYRASKYGHHLIIYTRVIWINRVSLPNLLVVSCIRGKYIYMYWHGTAVRIGLYTRYQYIFYLGGHVHSCTVHCCCIVCIYIYICVCVCLQRYVYVELVWLCMYGPHNRVRLPILLVVSS